MTGDQQTLVLAVVGGLAGGLLWSAFMTCVDALAAGLTALEQRDARIGAARARASRVVEVDARPARGDIDNTSTGHA